MEDFLMAEEPTYEELEQRVEDLELGNHLYCLHETKGDQKLSCLYIK
jgi:hypothetical protein